MSETYLSNWIANYLYVQPNRPISYDGRPWMPQIFDTDQRKRCLKTSRQVGKSTAGLALSTGLMANHDYFRVNYISPEKDQAKTFSREKIDPMMDGSPIFDYLKGDVNNVYEKRFSNKSTYKLNWAKHNPESIRGGTSDMIHYENGTVELVVRNYTDAGADLEVTDIVTAEPDDLSDGTAVDVDDEWFVKWNPRVEAGETATLSYSVDGDASYDVTVDGIEPEKLTIHQ
ncbi:MAG: phage terminase large subunit family protein [Bradymonadaceae bacterium]